MEILHLEDSANDAALAEALILAEWPDCRIHQVARRAEYEAAIHRGDFDLILSDHSMPDFDGLAALVIALSVRPDKPFIFMSGSLGEERAIEALQRGASDYILKDRPGRLVPAIRQALARADEKRRRQHAEDALRENRERFRLITENVADMIAVLGPDGRRVYHNPAYQELLGYGPDQPRPDAEPFAQVHPEDREEVRAIFANTLRTGAKHRVECRVVAPDDSIHHVESQVSAIRDDSGRVINVLVVARDITERKRNEARVRELAALVETARDAIYVRDFDQHITYWNPGAERLYGWTATEVLGHRAVELFYKAETPELLSIRQAILEKGEWTGELHQFDKQGRELVVLARRTLLRDATGEPVSILNINTDITEQRRLETRHLRDQRMEIIGSLTGGIAHDLNNMLSPILMGAELLCLGALDERARKTVAAISTSARHGTALVRQLMAFAKGNDGERVVIQIAPFLTEVEGLLRQTLPRTITLSVTAAPDCWPVLADATQLKQILVNLCINSRDAMPEGGPVSIRADNILVDAALAAEHPGSTPGAHLRIQVSDTGSGMPPAVMARIFDPFFTTKAPGKGTGLGLSTVLGIVKGHGGFLQVESEPGRGTVFRLHFPMLKIEPAVVAPVQVARPVACGRGETILVVDDDPGMRELMRALLTQQGFRPLLAADGPEGLALLQNPPAPVSAVISDWILPKMSGAQLVAAIHATYPGLPLLVISGMLANGLRPPDFDQNAVTALLPKPLDARLLLQTLRRAIDAAAPAPVAP